MQKSIVFKTFWISKVLKSSLFYLTPFLSTLNYSAGGSEVVRHFSFWGLFLRLAREQALHIMILLYSSSLSQMGKKLLLHNTALVVAAPRLLKSQNRTEPWRHIEKNTGR